MIKPLIWKEWQEQRWKLAFGTVMLAFFTGSLLAARISNDREIVVVIWIIGGWILSLYSAMGVFAPETSEGTKMFLASKPVKPWKSFLCKWFFGWLNFAIPMLLCGSGLVLISLLNPNESWFEKNIVKGCFHGICFGTMFYSMTCCLAPKKGSESVAGLTALVISVILFVHLGLTFWILNYYQLNQNVIAILLTALNPLVWIIGGFKTHVFGEIYIDQIILFIAVMLIGLRKWQRSI